MIECSINVDLSKRTRSASAIYRLYFRLHDWDFFTCVRKIWVWVYQIDDNISYFGQFHASLLTKALRIGIILRRSITSVCSIEKQFRFWIRAVFQKLQITNWIFNRTWIEISETPIPSPCVAEFSLLFNLKKMFSIF